MIPKKAKPAALAERLASISNRHHQRPLDSEAQSHSKPRHPNYSPADARPAPWADDDRAYFVAHPDNNERVRLPIEGEFPPCVLEPGRAAFVRISLIERDADGRPKRARRRLRFCEGGTA
ncbi:hypothetical protein SAMN05443247_06443 [Bradyrhizobium erythrophlei]|nr:hypothetical protein SAMN05443247_06443 [Bradyrhizobium erythrophlei]